MGITRPNFSDLNLFRYYTTTNDYVTGNPYLGPSINHNVELNYSYKQLYSVLYNSYNHNTIGYITRFYKNNSQSTVPENCINRNKIGIYISYNYPITTWWSIYTGGDLFYSHTQSKITDFNNNNDNNWSGKIDFTSNWMLTPQKNIILSLRFNQFFPYHDNMIHYKAISSIGADVKYFLLNNKLTLSASINDPFSWNITKSTIHYNNYRIITRNNIHSHTVSLRIAYSFGRDKVKNVFRDSKERESYRSY